MVHQHDPDSGEYDEDKVMLGFDSEEEAIGAYKKQYDRPGFYVDGEHVAMPIGQFWRWVNDERKQGKKVTGKRTGSFLDLLGRTYFKVAQELAKRVEMGEDLEDLIPREGRLRGAPPTVVSMIEDYVNAYLHGRVAAVLREFMARRKVAGVLRRGRVPSRSASLTGPAPERSPSGGECMTRRTSEKQPPGSALTTIVKAIGAVGFSNQGTARYVDAAIPAAYVHKAMEAIERALEVRFPGSEVALGPNSYVMSTAHGEDHDEKEYYLEVLLPGCAPINLVLGFSFPAGHGDLARLGYWIAASMRPTPGNRNVF